MHELMVGMFWGGLFMAVPPILVGAAIVMLLVQQGRLHRQMDRSDPGPPR